MMLGRLLTALAVLGVTTMAYKEGPPVTDYPGICTNMQPEHGTSDVMTEDLWEIKADTCFSETTNLNVHVKLKAKELDTFFEGFFLQARAYLPDGTTIDSTRSLGVFSTDDGDLQALACFTGDGMTNTAGDKNVAGHQKAKHYVDKTVQWTSTDDMNVAGTKFVFFATIVRHEEEIWKEIKSAEVSYDANCAPTVPAEPYITGGAHTLGATLAVLLAAVGLSFLL